MQNKGFSIKRSFFVHVDKYLNVVGAAMILDMLTTDKVENMIDKYLAKYYGIIVGQQYK
ncbi:hypothetical protein [Mesobacillus boroniphilus]|uniref:Uncharacterized protein n=1 Tax=Mesobacillus boroniphilus JCM 21738 TaxID=1294265 RepID=W4RU80_9BACI|nr:hypothetical protein [Mesobacillus boroniphilus]GAE47955.1 hypothetical protein JCM21738_5002 [Mesobacillus boroniphilus JCM 21738]